MRALATLLSAALPWLLACAGNQQSPSEEAGGAAGDGAAGAGPVCDEEASRHICNGDDELTFALVLPVPSGALVTPHIVMMELGYDYLYVTGQCAYWVGTNDPARGGGVYSAIRQGKLSEGEALQLACDTSYEDWPSLEGVYGNDLPSFSDYSEVFASDGVRTVVCSGDCNVSAPELHEGFWKRGMAWLEHLYRRGQAVDGPMRVRTVPKAVEGLKWYDWPLKSPPNEYQYPPNQEPDYGDSPLIDDEEDLGALRQLRAEYEDDGMREISVLLYTNDPETPDRGYTLGFRDTIPLENEHGGIPLPLVPVP